MKNLKYILSTMLFVALVACEEDINNQIPEGAVPTRTELHQSFKSTLLQNTIAQNQKIWLSSSALKLRDRDNKQDARILNELTGERYTAPFFVGFDFSPAGKVKVYVTEKYIHQTKSGNTTLFDNPNTFHIGGTLQTNLTILQLGVLSRLRRDLVLDHDYLVDSVSQDRIKLMTHNDKLENLSITLQPYDYTAFVNFAAACQMLYSPKKDWESASITIKDKSTGNTLHDYKVFGNIQYFKYLLNQIYYKAKRLHMFRLIEQSKIKSDDPKISSIATSLKVKNFYDLEIQYLHPTQVTANQLVFDTYGAADAETTEGSTAVAEDKKYEMTLAKLDLQEELKKVLPKHTISQNNKIWLSSRLDVDVQGQTLNFITSASDYDLGFFIAFDFNPTDLSQLNTYATIGYNQQEFDPVGNRQLLYNNPTLFSSNRKDMLFESKILNSFHRPKKSYDVLKLNEFIALSPNKFVMSDGGLRTVPDRNKSVTFRPHDFTDFQKFAQACQVLYAGKNFSGKNDYTNIWRNGFIQVTDMKGTRVKLVQTAQLSAFSHLLSQTYDERTGLLLFRFVDFTKKQIQDAVSGYYSNILIDEIYNQWNWKYLRVTKVSLNGVSRGHTFSRIDFEAYGDDLSAGPKHKISIASYSAFSLK